MNLMIAMDKKPKGEFEMNLFKSLTLLLCFFIYSSILYAAQATISATIIETEGYACMGDDKSKKQTEQFALIDAKRKASEAALTNVKSETKVQNAELQKDLVAAYSNAQVKIIQELNKAWYKDTSAGDCYKVTIKAEVLPDMEAIMASGQPKTQAKDSMIDASWHRYKDRKLDIWGSTQNTAKISIPTDGWRLIGPTNENKDEYEWGWEVTITLTPQNREDRVPTGLNLLLTISEIKYILLDEDGFVLTSDSLNISEDNSELGSMIWKSDEGSIFLAQGFGTAKTYRQTSKINIQKALRAKGGKYQIFVK